MLPRLQGNLVVASLRRIGREKGDAKAGLLGCCPGDLIQLDRSHGQVMGGLEVHPEAGRGAGRLPEQNGALGGDSALAVNDLAKAHPGYPHAPGESGLGQLQGLEELLFQDLAGRNEGRTDGNPVGCLRVIYDSVIIGYFPVSHRRRVSLHRKDSIIRSYRIAPSILDY